MTTRMVVIAISQGRVAIRHGDSPHGRNTTQKTITYGFGNLAGVLTDHLPPERTVGGP